MPEAEAWAWLSNAPPLDDGTGPAMLALLALLGVTR